MIKSNVDIHRDLLNTVKRGIERIENNQCTDLADLEKTRERKRAWKKRNPENQRKHVDLWKEKNSHKLNSYNGKRRAAKLLRTPKWLTADDLFMIEEAYHLAKLKGREIDRPRNLAKSVTVE